MYRCITEYTYPTKEKMYRIKALDSNGDVFDAESIVDRNTFINMIADCLIVNASAYVRGADLCIKLGKDVSKVKSKKKVSYIDNIHGFYIKILEYAVAKIKVSYINLITDNAGIMRQLKLEKYTDSKYMKIIDFNQIIAELPKNVKNCYVAGIHAIEGFTNEVRIITANKGIAEKFINEYCNRLSIKHYSNCNSNGEKCESITQLNRMLKEHAYIQNVSSSTN